VLCRNVGNKLDCDVACKQTQFLAVAVNLCCLFVLFTIQQ